MLRYIAMSVLAAGQAVAQVPAFDVASVRRVQSQGARMELRETAKVSPDGVTMRSVSLRAAVAWAHHVFEFQVAGPDWMAVERYDIAAKAAAPVPEDQLRLMMQSLLADRFKLAVHQETKEQPAFLLTVGKNGPKFQASTETGEAKVEPDPLRFTVTISRMGVPQVVEILANVLKAPIVDRTELRGKYDVSISLQKYLPEPGGNPASFDIVSTIIMAFREELGLNLESKKMPIGLVIVDRAEKAPVEN